MLLPTLILTIIAMILIVSGIGLRMLLIKGGEFRGTCSQNNPMLTNQIGNCTVCGKGPEEQCKNDEVAIS